MNDENVKVEITAEEPVANSARQELEALMRELFPEKMENGDTDQVALDYIREMKEMNDKLVAALSEDPQMAQVLAEMVDGGKSAQSLIRHFGREFFDVEEGTPEYDEIMAADAEFQQNKQAMKEKEAAFDEKAKAFFAALDDYCNRKNLNADVYKVRIVDEVLIPALDWVATDEFFDRLVNAVDYNKDVEDAFHAGEIKGRNMNINELRAKPTDGMPGGLGTHAPATETPKRRVNSLIASALNA